jgi:hypothetical protein
MLIWRKFTKTVFLRMPDLEFATEVIEKSVKENFDACIKKEFDVLESNIDSYEIEINNSESECVAKCRINALLHQPEIGEVVCGDAVVTESYIVVCVSKYFKVFIKHPQDFESLKVHALITLIKNQKSSLLIALGEQQDLSCDALRCGCPNRQKTDVCV